MSDSTTRLSLPLMQPAQAQKHITHNEAIARLDLLTQLVIESAGTDTPPASPVEGTIYFTGVAPSGDWSGKPAQLAAYLNGGWEFITPNDGWRLWDKATATLKVWSSGALQNANGTLTTLGINTAADTTNRLAVSAPATLLTHEGAGHQLKINKAATSDTASLLFQSNWTGYAEMGLSGSDDFAIKVSDGASWTTALSASGTNGAVTLAGVLTLPAVAEPTSPVSGTIYFDSTTAKLRCFDGTIWQDLF